MKKLLTVAILALVSTCASAETAYTSDSVEFVFRAAESARGRIIGVLPGGTELTVIHTNPRSGFSKIKTTAGVEGYIFSKNLTATPGAKAQLVELNLKNAALTEENNILKSELKAAKGDNTAPLTPSQSLIDERDKARQELAELKTASSQTVQLKEQRDQLQARTVTVERELEQLKRENQTLQNASDQTWLLYGGAVAIAGILLGLLLPKLAWKKRSSGWDTF